MAARKPKKPKHKKSEYPTLPGQLGYLNSYFCPVCGKHLFSAYDKDMRKDREDGYYFYISRDFNYCSKCGTLLDLEEWKRKEEPPEAGGRTGVGRLGGAAVVAAAKRKTIPKSVRQQVYDSMKGRCGYCGCNITYKEMQVDHIEAVYLHEEELNDGEAQQINRIENYMPACRACNFYKSTMSVEKFRKQLETLQERLEKIFIYRLAKKYGIVKEVKKPVQFYFEKVKNGGGSS